MARLGRFIALVAVTLLLAGCGEQAAVLPPTPIPTDVPTQTPEVAFTVDVTAVPQPTHRPTPQPAPTRFVPPPGPYVVLIPSSGPPVSQQVTVRGGNLPPSSSVLIGWSPDGRQFPITRIGFTDRRGRMSAAFSIPASTPGRYRVVVSVNGVRYAQATYRVESRAVLSANASPQGSAERLALRGTGFVPGEKLLFIAYSMSVRAKPVVLGSARCGKKGGFRFAHVLTSLPPGQYAVRAYSNDGLSAQMAEAFFQVVI